MRAARCRVRGDAKVIERSALNALVVVMRNSNEDADVAPFLEIEDQAGIFDCFPSRLEQQAMLRIDVGSFARRDPKKLGIELVDLIEKPSALGEGSSRNPWLRIVIPLYVPPIGRHLGDRVAAFDEQFPERLGVVASAGEAASDSNDCDAVF